LKISFPFAEEADINSVAAEALAIVAHSAEISAASDNDFLKFIFIFKFY